MQLALQGKLWKEWLDKGEAREHYMIKWRAKQELLEGKRHERYLREGNTFKDMVVASMIHDRRFVRLDRARPHQMLVDGHEGEERGAREEERGDIEEVESENYVSDQGTDIVDRREVSEDDEDESDSWTLRYETNSPVEFSRTETQMETEEDENFMSLNDGSRSRRQRGRGVSLAKAGDRRRQGQGLVPRRRGTGHTYQSQTTVMGKGGHEIPEPIQESVVMDMRLENAEEEATFADIRVAADGVEVVQPGVRWISEIEHMAAGGGTARVPFEPAWRRALMQGLRGSGRGTVDVEREVVSDPNRGQQLGELGGTLFWRQNWYRALRLSSYGQTGKWTRQVGGSGLTQSLEETSTSLSVAGGGQEHGLGSSSGGGSGSGRGHEQQVEAVGEYSRVETGHAPEVAQTGVVEEDEGGRSESSGSSSGSHSSSGNGSNSRVVDGRNVSEDVHRREEVTILVVESSIINEGDFSLGGNDGSSDSDSGWVANINARTAAEFIQRFQAEASSLQVEENKQMQEESEEEVDGLGQATQQSRRKGRRASQRKKKRKTQHMLQAVDANLCDGDSYEAGEPYGMLEESRCQDQDLM